MVTVLPLDRVSGACHKRFMTRAEAEAFIESALGVFQKGFRLSEKMQTFRIR
jgi:hypothetical protein